MGKATLYFHTIRTMKLSQVTHRIRKKLGLRCTIGCRVQKPAGQVRAITVIPELDFDQVFLKRFSCDDLLQNKVTFLHESQIMDWQGSWKIPDQSDLWNFNLHYFEYLFPLWSAFCETGNRQYLYKAEETVRGWIIGNPQAKGGTGWSPYTIDLRLTHWLSFYTYAKESLSDELKKMMYASIYDQYSYLSEHIEKDILGNHYFEDLKTLVICAAFFDDKKMLECAVNELKKECKEEILPDGMHFERSPMYHKLVLEGLMKAAAVLRGCGHPDETLEGYIQPMLDAAWSVEESLERLPLFNDSGDNVAKSLDALVKAAAAHFALKPVYRSCFPNAGFWLFRQGKWKLIVDAGDPGPSYIPGHVHCDALSFELFCNGRPVLVNCGTYAYQSQLRSFFRSTLAHNTVCIDGTEQSQCWGVFRVAKRSFVRAVEADDHHLSAVMTDQAGHQVTRRIDFAENLTVTDESAGHTLTAALHFLRPLQTEFTAQSVQKKNQLYAPEYGACSEIEADIYEGSGKISARIILDHESEERI